MSRPQISFRALLRPQKKFSRGPESKQKNYFKINSRARIEGAIEKQFVKLHEWTSKQFLSPTLNTKIAQWGPKKSKQPQN